MLILPEVPWLMPSAFIQRHASMMACRFSFSALLTACSDLVATRGPWGFGDRGLIRADKVAMPGGSSNSSCDGDLKVIRGGSCQEPHPARPGTAASAKVAIPL